MTIVSEESTVIRINNREDTSTMNVYYAGTIFTPRPKKIKIDTIKEYFTLAEKDTIFHLAKDIIQNPAKPKSFCTDFVGDLKLVIYYGRFKEPGSFQQSIEYSGVCNWDTLSDKTIQLNNILNRKAKNSNSR